MASCCTTPACGARISISLQLVRRRDLAFDQLGDLGTDVGKLLGHVAAQVLIELDDLQLGLGDLSLSLRHGGDELPALPFEPRRIALERGHAVDRDQVLLPEIAHALELLLDELDLLALGAGLVGIAAHLLVQLDDALPQLRLLSFLCGASQLEQLALAGDHAGNFGLPGRLHQFGRKFDVVAAVTLRLQPGTARKQFGQALVDHRQVRLRRRFIEPEQKLARPHA